MTLNKILRNTILVGIWLVPFIPLYVANTMFFPFITGKNFAFRIIVEVVLALWVVLALRDKSYAPGKSAIGYSVGAFLAIIALADIFGANFYRSFWSNYERMEGLVALIHMCAYFLVLGSVLNTDKLWDRYLKTILGVGILLVAYSLAQIMGWLTIDQGAFRVDATLGNATYLAVHMLFMAFIAAFLYLRAKSVRWLYPILALAYLFVLYNTETRGAIIGLVAGLLVAALVMAFSGDAKLKKIAGYSLGLLALLLILFIPARNLDFVKNSPTLGRFAEINLDSITKEPRLMVWGMALQGFKEHPILGWGQDNFNLVFNKYYNPEMYAQEPWFDRAHDVFFDWLIAGGLLGLLSYLSMFGAAIYTIFKGAGRLNFSLADKAVFIGMFVAYFVQNIFVFDNLVSYMVFFTLLAYLHYGSRTFAPAAQSAAKSARAVGQPDEIFDQVIYAIVLIAASFLIYFANIKPIMASRSLIDALSTQDLKQGLEDFKGALALQTFGSGETREQLAQRVVNLRNLNVDNSVKLEYFNLAKDEMQKQIDSSPNDARYRLFMGTLLSAYGLQDDALAQINKAIELSPNKQTILFQLISVYINKRDYDKAFELAKFTYNLEPNWSESQRIYAVVAVYDKKDSSPDVQDILIKLYGTNTPIDDKFVGAYAAVGRYDKIISIWRKKIDADPSNPNYHLSLAASYLADGQRAASIAELRTVIKLNPSFAPTAEHYISEIQAGRNP